jgi:hypothetical protein
MVFTDRAPYARDFLYYLFPFSLQTQMLLSRKARDFQKLTDRAVK